MSFNIKCQYCDNIEERSSARPVVTCMDCKDRRARLRTRGIRDNRFQIVKNIKDNTIEQENLKRQKELVQQQKQKIKDQKKTLAEKQKQKDKEFKEKYIRIDNRNVVYQDGKVYAQRSYLKVLYENL